MNTSLSKVSSFFVPLIFAVAFFIIALLTLESYGPSWDETIHFRRGQAYLHYFLTGEKEYKVHTSFYQNDIQNGQYFFNKDIGHPPLNDQIAAFLNYIFYQQLNVLDDISSHHLFNILISSLLVFSTTFIAFRYFGFFPSLVAFLALSTYPLFFAESHFNIKDPAEASFFTATLLGFVLWLEKKSIKYFIFSAFFFALALGTKFNILFLPFIVVPYVFIAYRDRIKFNKSYLLTLFVTSIGVFSIFILSWPYLWQDTFARLGNILTFYRETGSGTRYQPDDFFVLGFNTFPVLWIIYTTPPLVLLLTTVGIISAWINRGLKNKITVLLLLWLIVPILRVSIPGSSIYGGIRQILEFLPAFVLLSGFGVWQITRWVKNSQVTFFVKVAIVLAFFWQVAILVKLHPYQNVYFNFLIGGLKGASEVNFPSWGNSLGNAYMGGIAWLNQYSENGAKLALIQGTPSNVPPPLLREDINFLVDGDIDTKKSYFSGFNREGEYIMELTFNDTGRDFYYTWEYVESFLDPVYQVEVDGVPILKVWHNSIENTKKDRRFREYAYSGSVGLSKLPQGNVINLSLEQEVILSRIQLKFTKDTSCSSAVNGWVETSTDELNWVREKSNIPSLQVGRISNLEDNMINFHIAGKRARFVRFTFDNPKSCPLNNTIASVFMLR